MAISVDSTQLFVGGNEVASAPSETLRSTGFFPLHGHGLLFLRKALVHAVLSTRSVVSEVSGHRSVRRRNRRLCFLLGLIIFFACFVGDREEDDVDHDVRCRHHQ